MRCPDSATGHHAGNNDPNFSLPGFGRERAMKQINGRETGKQTNDRGQYYKPPIMFIVKAVKNSEHPVITLLAKILYMHPNLS